MEVEILLLGLCLFVVCVIVFFCFFISLLVFLIDKCYQVEDDKAIFIEEIFNSRVNALVLTFIMQLILVHCTKGLSSFSIIKKYYIIQ